MAYPLINGAAINADEDSGGNTTVGFMRTRYGQHTVVHVAGENKVIGPATLGQSTQLGTHRVVGATIVLGVLSAVRSTHMGTPTVVATNIVVDGPALAVPSLGMVTRMGALTARSTLAVQASSIAPATALGTPRVRPGFMVAGFRTTAFGTPRVAHLVRVSSIQSTQFGAPRAARIIHVPSLPGLRYGAPSVVGSVTGTTVGFRSTEYGTHSINLGIHVLPAAPATRFGRHTIARNSQC